MAENKIILELANNAKSSGNNSGYNNKNNRDEEKRSKGSLKKLAIIAAAVGTSAALLSKASPALRGSFELFKKSFFITLAPLGNMLNKVIRPWAIQSYKTSILAYKGWLKLDSFLSGEEQEKRAKNLRDQADALNNLANAIKIPKDTNKTGPAGVAEDKKIEELKNRKKELEYMGDIKRESSDVVANFQTMDDLLDNYNKSPFWSKLNPLAAYTGLTSYTGKSSAIESSTGLLESQYQGMRGTLISEGDFSSKDKYTAILLKNWKDLLEGDDGVFNEKISKEMKDILGSDYSKFIDETTGKPKDALQKYFDGETSLENFAKSIKSDVVGDLPSQFKGNNTMMSYINQDLGTITNATSKDLTDMANNTVDESASAIEEKLSALENFTINLGKFGTFKPFQGLLGLMGPTSPISKITSSLFSDMFAINDGIITKDGKVIKTDPNDTIMASKNGFQGMGTTVNTMNVNISVKELNSDSQMIDIAQKVSEYINRELSYRG